MHKEIFIFDKKYLNQNSGYKKGPHKESIQARIRAPCHSSSTAGVYINHPTLSLPKETPYKFKFSRPCLVPLFSF